MDTDWEQLYQEGVKPWDKGAASPPLGNWLEKNPQKFNGQILVPGCGLGHDARAISALRPDTEPLGIDVSATALAQAAEFPKVGNETFEELDLFNLPDAMQGSFDWAWEHTCFCAINPDRRDEYVEAVSLALKPAGELLGIFYLDPYDDEHQPSGGRPPFGTSFEELEQRFVGSGRFSIKEKYVPDVSYGGREGLELMLRLSKP